MRQRALFAATLFALTAFACQSTSEGDEPMCKLRKPGTIVSVNEYCVMVLDDPVDPTVVTEWKGQKVSFCCVGCIPKWNMLSDTEKEAALARAVAKGKIKD